jgi:erythromycin esterase-like protein
MAQDSQNLSTRASVAARRVAATLIAGVWRTRSAREVDVWLRRRSRQNRALVIGGVLAALLGLSIVAAQFGWVGMLVFWLGVIILVN